MTLMSDLRSNDRQLDYRNQMVEHHDDELTQPHKYAYDCFGRRVVRSVYGTAGLREDTRTVFAGNSRGATRWQAVEEYSPSALRVSYVHGNYIDEHLLMRREADGVEVFEPQVVRFLQDDLFNVVALTDWDGYVAERYEYGDYGQPRVLSAALELMNGTEKGNRWLFQGREWDAETGLYQFRFRYLEPTLGRLTSNDVIGRWADGANRGNGVAFNASAPIVRLDPFGLAGTRPGVPSDLPPGLLPPTRNPLQWQPNESYDPSRPGDSINRPGQYYDPKSGDTWSFHPADKAHNSHWDLTIRNKYELRVPIGDLSPLKDASKYRKELARELDTLRQLGKDKSWLEVPGADRMKILGPLFIGLGFYFAVEDAHGAMTKGECGNFWRRVRHVAETGRCDPTTLQNAADGCKIELSEKGHNLSGGVGAITAHEYWDDFAKTVIEACRSCQ